VAKNASCSFGLYLVLYILCHRIHVSSSLKLSQHSFQGRWYCPYFSTLEAVQRIENGGHKEWRHLMYCTLYPVRYQHRVNELTF